MQRTRPAGERHAGHGEETSARVSRSGIGAPETKPGAREERAARAASVFTVYSIHTLVHCSLFTFTRSVFTVQYSVGGFHARSVVFAYAFPY